MESTSPEGVPVPRRIAKPRWLDIRVIGGLVLVVAAVVVGAEVVGASAHTSPVWTAARDLASGTVLTSSDLVPIEVNLAGNANRYLAAGSGSASLVGSTIAVPLRAGELVPASAVQVTEQGRVVVIGVAPDHLPPAVVHGSVIDVYLTVGGSTSSAQARTDLISSGVTVQSVAAPSTGGLSGATSNRFQVAVLVPEATADVLVRTLPKGDAIIALVAGSR